MQFLILLPIKASDILQLSIHLIVAFSRAVVSWKLKLPQLTSKLISLRLVHPLKLTEAPFFVFKVWIEFNEVHPSKDIELIGGVELILTVVNDLQFLKLVTKEGFSSPSVS